MPKSMQVVEVLAKKSKKVKTKKFVELLDKTGRVVGRSQQLDRFEPWTRKPDTDYDILGTMKQHKGTK